MSQPTPPPATAKPPRSAAERVIVWGVIAIGLVVILVEGQAHLAHASALQKLQDQLKKSAEKDGGMTQKDVDSLLGKAPESQQLDPLATGMGASKVDIFRFNGLGLRERKIYVYYGIDGKTNQPAEVMEVGAVPAETPAEVAARAPKPDPNAPPAGGMVAGPAPMMGPPGPPGPPGGGPGGPGGAPGRPAAEDDDKGAEKSAADDGEKKDAKPDEPKPDAPKTDAEKLETEKKE